MQKQDLYFSKYAMFEVTCGILNIGLRRLVMKKVVLAICVIVCGVNSSIIYADTIILRDGSEFECRILKV